MHDVTQTPSSHHSAAAAALFAAVSAASSEAADVWHSSAAGPRGAPAASRAEPFYMCDVTHSYVWQNLIYVHAMPYSYV